MMGWRVWLAFEIRPGITRATIDRSATYRALATTCRASDGRIDPAEYERWIDCLTERIYMPWGEA